MVKEFPAQAGLNRYGYNCVSMSLRVPRASGVEPPLMVITRRLMVFGNALITQTGAEGEAVSLSDSARREISYLADEYHEITESKEAGE